MPRPLKMEWYSPASDSFTSRLVRISIRRIFFRISAGSIGGRALREPGACSSGDFDRVQHPLDDLLRRHVLGLRLVREDDPVAEGVEGHRLPVLRGDVAAPAYEGM